MARINPNAIIFWIIGAAIGYLVNDLRGLAAGVVATIAISLIVGILDDMQTQKRWRRW